MTGGEHEMAGGLKQEQIDLEKRLGMSIWEIREKILDLPNDERWAYMTENQISGGPVFLAPSQYPKRPAGEMEITEARCHQMTIDEWLGLEEKNDMKKIKEARR